MLLIDPMELTYLNTLLFQFFEDNKLRKVLTVTCLRAC